MGTFDRISPEKQTEMINAALTCFGRSGYKKASVADIAAAAGVSKASVFQYFGSKKALYLYLLKFAAEQITAGFPDGGEDFFDSLRLGSDAKLRVMARCPGMYDFLSSIVTETDPEIAAETVALLSAWADAGKQALFSKVDWGKLRPDVPPEQMLYLIRWVNDGYIRDALGKKDAPTMQRELFMYMELVRRACYKEEFLL